VTSALTYAQAPHPYTPAVGAGDLVFVSGRLGVRDAEFVSGAVEADATQALRNAEAELAPFNLDLTHVVKVTVFRADIADLQALNQAYIAVMPEPRPARSCVAVDALPFNGRVEIEIIASAQRRTP
jgi:2-iminobutanoate/2-iminopropanoate deaminase